LEYFENLIAEINRRVDAEPDLDRRVSILKEAADRFPGETYFAPALRLMKDNATWSTPSSRRLD